MGDIEMFHPELNTVITVAERSAHVYEKSGWERVEGQEPNAEDGGAQEDAPADTSDTETQEWSWTETKEG